MSVYVDDLFWPYRGMKMCHLLADTHDELMAMASKLNMRLSWIQEEGEPSEHFDVSIAKRRLALRYGAVAITKRQAVRIVQRKRAGLPPPHLSA